MQLKFQEERKIKRHKTRCEHKRVLQRAKTIESRKLISWNNYGGRSLARDVSWRSWQRVKISGQWYWGWGSSPVWGHSGGGGFGILDLANFAKGPNYKAEEQRANLLYKPFTFHEQILFDHLAARDRWEHPWWWFFVSDRIRWFLLSRI